MRKIFYTLLAAITLNAQSAQAMMSQGIVIDYGKAVTQQYPGLDACEWSYDGQEFTVHYNDQDYLVDPFFVDTVLHGISKEQLLGLLEEGYLYINRLDDGQFTIKVKMRLEGGMWGSRRKKSPPLLVMLIFGLGCAAYKGVEYLLSDNDNHDRFLNDLHNLDPVPAAPAAPRRIVIPKDNPVAQAAVNQAVKDAPAIRSEGNKVEVAAPCCVVGPGLVRPMPIIGGGGAKGPFMRIVPMDPIPTPTAPAPRGPNPQPAPRPGPTIRPPVIV